MNKEGVDSARAAFEYGFSGGFDAGQAADARADVHAFSGNKLRFGRDTARGKTVQNVPSCTTRGVAAIGRATDRIPVHAPIFQLAANIDPTNAQAGD